MMTDSLWFPPLNIAAHHEADFRGLTPPKKVEEMMAVAIAMTGLQELQQKRYWIQGVPDTERSPDVRTMFRDEVVDGRAPQAHQQDVEVVDYTPYSTEMNLAEFVAATKLSSRKGYDALTNILVNVQAGTRLPLATEWTATLGPTRKVNKVLVLGLISQSQPFYRLAVVHPVVEGAVDFHAIDLMKRHESGGGMRFVRGTKARDWKTPNEKHCPFEKFGVKCNLIQ